MDELYFEDDDKESLDEELRDETEEAERSSEIDSSEQAEIPGSENIVEEFNNTNLEEVHEIEDVESRDNRNIVSYSTESKAERLSFPEEEYNSTGDNTADKSMDNSEYKESGEAFPKEDLSEEPSAGISEINGNTAVEEPEADKTETSEYKEASNDSPNEIPSKDGIDDEKLQVSESNGIKEADSRIDETQFPDEGDDVKLTELKEDESTEDLSQLKETADDPRNNISETDSTGETKEHERPEGKAFPDERIYPQEVTHESEREINQGDFTEPKEIEESSNKTFSELLSDLEEQFAAEYEAGFEEDASSESELKDEIPEWLEEELWIGEPDIDTDVTSRDDFDRTSSDDIIIDEDEAALKERPDKVEAAEIRTVDDLKKLECTENFTENAINHIFNGEINGAGRAVGYHSESIEDAKGNIINETRSDKDINGVYEGKVIIDGVEKGAKSSFFPEDMTPQEIVDAINEAYCNRVFDCGNTYYGIAKSGIQIQLFLDRNDKIISAFPVLMEENDD